MMNVGNTFAAVTFGWSELAQTMLAVNTTKVAYEIVALPLSIKISDAMKCLEEIDTVGTPGDTRYSLLSH